jgi:hypothetical protein
VNRAETTKENRVRRRTVTRSVLRRRIVPNRRRASAACSHLPRPIVELRPQHVTKRRSGDGSTRPHNTPIWWARRTVPFCATWRRRRWSLRALPCSPVGGEFAVRALAIAQKSSRGRNSGRSHVPARLHARTWHTRTYNGSAPCVSECCCAPNSIMCRGPSQRCDSRGTLELEISGAAERASPSANQDGASRGRKSGLRDGWTPDSRTRANRLFLVCCEIRTSRRD